MKRFYCLSSSLFFLFLFLCLSFPSLHIVALWGPDAGLVRRDSPSTTRHSRHTWHQRLLLALHFFLFFHRNKMASRFNPLWTVAPTWLSAPASSADLPRARSHQAGCARSIIPAGTKLRDFPLLFAVSYYWVIDLPSLINALQIPKHHLLGHSWRTIVAHKYVIAFPLFFRASDSTVREGDISQPQSLVLSGPLSDD